MSEAARKKSICLEMDQFSIDNKTPRRAIWKVVDKPQTTSANGQDLAWWDECDM